MADFDYAVVGGGIVGLSAAMHLVERYPGSRVVVFEKEPGPSLHQTGRNSGVIHSGIYYKPGSFKARFAASGAGSMVAFCREHEIAHHICGKLIVATDREELPLLEELHRRALQNRVPVERYTPEQAREIEPFVNCVAALLVKSTGITSYREVSLAFLRRIKLGGGTVHFRSKVRKIHDRGALQVVETTAGDHSARFVINCGGLYSDRIARAAGSNTQARIIPFRGEYYELKPERRRLVNSLIYPVPNPEFPFLGVHFTKMIDGSVHAGPNAVLALAREGYAKRDFNLRDMAEIVTFGGFWRLARRHLGEGIKEIHRSLSKKAFVRSLQRLVPDVKEEDLTPCNSGIRAQALLPDGRLVDDFLMIPTDRTLHVCNAPSPAATASLEIGRTILEQIPELSIRTTVAFSK